MVDVIQRDEPPKVNVSTSQSFSLSMINLRGVFCATEYVMQTLYMYVGASVGLASPVWYKYYVIYLCDDDCSTICYFYIWMAYIFLDSIFNLIIRAERPTRLIFSVHQSHEQNSQEQSLLRLLPKSITNNRNFLYPCIKSADSDLTCS